ncbi:MAG: minor capsid protein [Quinella sp. 1Q7]|nr:minor capsid protein [Quinella sp. 1Q7]
MTTEELRKLKRYYVKAAADIERDIAALYAKYATENGLSMTAARKLIRGDEFKSWRLTLEEYVRKSKVDPKILRELNTLTARSRISRLEALHARTLMETIDLAERLQEAADAHLARAYLETYYGNLYDFHKTIGLSTPPNAVDAKRVESVLQTAWVGKNYSSRIWANQARLANELEATLLQAIHRGSSIQQLSKALSRRMDVAYSNAERLIRTELNAVENRASEAAMKAAEFTHYQFMATLDRRTCARCGERDGEVYKLSEMNQGENAPPMHARCRCTIVAYDGGGNGQRVAGRERLPEGVTYKQWRARYVDGEPPTIIINNYEDVAKVRTQSEFTALANQIKPIVEPYTGRASKWNGKIMVADDGDRAGGKHWSCSIRLNPDVPEHVLIHEMIHSCSASHYGAQKFFENKFEEELTVHYLSQELAVLKKILVVDSGYDNGVELIREFKRALGIKQPDLEFASALIRQPLGERWDWLGGLIPFGGTIEQYQNLLSKLEAIRQWKTS